MKEDACSVRKDNAPEDLSLLKKIVLNLLRMDTTDNVKFRSRLKSKRAALDHDFSMHFLGFRPLWCSSAEAMFILVMYVSRQLIKRHNEAPLAMQRRQSTEIKRNIRNCNIFRA